MRYPVGCPSVGEREIAMVVHALKGNELSHGSMVEHFEACFAAALDVKHAIACTNGTSALHLALAALKVKAGDEVLVPDLTYVATANAVAYTGATPVLVDVDATTWNLSLEDAARKVSAKTVAIIPVHLFGVPCDMKSIQIFANNHSLDVIEDAAEGLGGYYDDQALGTLGLCGTFSFYANKVITTGEGGAIVTNDDDFAASVRLLRRQSTSSTDRFWHGELGYNYRMTSMQAAIGLVQAQRMNELLIERHRVVRRYRRELADCLSFPEVSGMAPWMFTARLPVGVSYAHVEQRMALSGIEVRPIFTPMHQLPMYKRPDCQFPVSTALHRSGISLPTYPDLSDDDVSFIATALRQALS